MIQTQTTPFPVRPLTLRRVWGVVASAVVLAAGAAGVLLAAPVGGESGVTLRLVAWLLLTWALPGVLLALAWRLPGADWVDVGLAALGLGAAWLVLGALVIHWLPGPIALWQLLTFYGGGMLVLGGLLVTRAARRPLRIGVVDRRTLLWGLALLVTACLLRLPGLGYHEFHADEAVLLRQAGRAIRGEDDALANHTKGPGEIAVITSFYRAVGTADEGMARLPFALMSVGSVLALAWLGLRLVNGHVGLWAGLLLAVNGFALGLSRIAQYQAAVLLLSVLSVWAMWAFARKGRYQYLTLAAVFCTTGLVMHYEFGLLAPVLLLLLGMGWRRSSTPHVIARVGVLATLAAVAVLAAAYLPALFSDYFATTQGYLGNRLGGPGVMNLPFLVEMGTFYNSSYFFFGLVLLAAMGTWLAWQRDRLVAVLLTLWWLPFFLLYIFIVRYPGTHFYLLMQSWSLLAALPLAALSSIQLDATPRVGSRLRAGVLALVALWLGVSTYYLYLLFFRQSPEYLVNIDQERAGVYWAPYTTPQKPRFGFPILEGWKALGVLGEWGYLGDTYATNDDNWAIRRWYLTAYTKRDFDEEPDFIFVARHLQEVNPEFDDAYLDAYTRAGEVRVRGEPRIEIWARTPLPVPYVTYDLESFVIPFREDVAALMPAALPPALVRDVPLGDALLLRRAGVNTLHPAQREMLHLELVWEPQAPLPVDYKLFVHVAGPDGAPVIQWDGLPGLNTARTSTWAVGEPFTDHVLIPLVNEEAAAVPAGRYRLLVGLYDPATGDRVGGTAIDLGEVTIR